MRDADRDELLSCIAALEREIDRLTDMTNSYENNRGAMVWKHNEQADRIATLEAALRLACEGLEFECDDTRIEIMNKASKALGGGEKP